MLNQVKDKNLKEVVIRFFSKFDNCKVEQVLNKRLSKSEAIELLGSYKFDNDNKTSCYFIRDNTDINITEMRRV